MPYAFTLDDVAFIRSASLEGADSLALTPASLLGDLAKLRAGYGERAAAVAETVMLRRRAGTKLAHAADWLFTTDALQQATPTAVAAHRARRLAGRDVHDVTCSIGAELAALKSVTRTVIGSDLDPVRLAMAQHNVPDATLVRADALAPCTRDTVVIADPARRADGRRTHDPALLQPPLPALLDIYRGCDLAVKCAPGLDTARLGWAGEVELTSLDGGVREACLWSRGLATPGVRSRATVLTTAGTCETLTDAEPSGIPERAPGQWIINPDGAIVRAGLVRQYAARHGLWQLDPRIAYLTGDTVPAGVRGFRIHAQMKFREKVLRQELARMGCGTLEILARGVDVDPDALRARLLAGRKQAHSGAAYAVVITRIGQAPVAFICTTEAPGPH